MPGGTLTRAQAAHLTPYGRAEAGWERRGDTVTVTAVVPPTPPPWSNSPAASRRSRSDRAATPSPWRASRRLSGLRRRCATRSPHRRRRRADRTCASGTEAAGRPRCPGGSRPAAGGSAPGSTRPGRPGPRPGRAALRRGVRASRGWLTPQVSSALEAMWARVRHSRSRVSVTACGGRLAPTDRPARATAVAEGPPQGLTVIEW
ncbi:alpha-L-rhamnosidase C-terminal domain-containing protein [Streptomyces purpurascens]